MSLFNLSKDDWQERISRLIEDLYTLEVNTIEKPGMTARRMPPIPTAIAEVADKYRQWLKEKAGALASKSADVQKIAGDMSAMELSANRADEFEKLADAADLLKDAGLLSPSDDVVCQRIWRNSAYLYNFTFKAENTGSNNEPVVKSVTFTDWRAYEDAQTAQEREQAVATKRPTRITLENLVWIDDATLEDAWSVDFKDRAKIRKIWEVGTEMVLVQTAIQLEGDVITRISPRIAGKGEFDDVMKVHQQSIETSMKMWSQIVQAVSSLPKVFGF